MIPTDFGERMAKRMTEKELLDNVRSAAKQFGWMVYHTHRSDRSEPGFPDLMLIKGTHLLAVELKTETGRTTPAQDAWLDAFRGVTHRPDALIWRPRHWVSRDIVNTLALPAGGQRA